MKIYIVEDHPFMREMLRDYLACLPDLEATVCGEANSGEAALEGLADVEADLVLVDVSLSGMSGIEFVEAAQERQTGLCCVMLSGHGEATYARQALAAGARGLHPQGRPLRDERRPPAGARGRGVPQRAAALRRVNVVDL